MRLSELSNEEVLASLKSLVGDGNRIVAKIVAYLAEVEERRIHLELACSSMFEFCTRKLGFSEGEAFRRITAARLARRFPPVLDAIASGRVHLTTIVLLRDHFSDENIGSLLEQTAGRSKREVEELVARLAPKADVPSSIRKLPERAPAPVTSRPTPPDGGAVPNENQTPTRPETRDARQEHGALPTTTATHVSSAPGAPEQVALPSQKAMMTRSTIEEALRSRVQPLSAARYRVQLTASTALRDKLEKARRLMGHRNPGGDLAMVVEEAIDLLIEQLEKAKLGKAERPRATTKAPQDPARVTHATRREVVARDGLQCAFIGSNGERCTSREHLEFDHRVPRALGGSGDAPNVRIVCRAHNRFAAEQVFGRQYIEERTRFRQQKCGTGAEPRERIRGALRAMGFRSAEAERAIAGIDQAGWAGRPIELLMRDAIGLMT